MMARLNAVAILVALFSCYVVPYLLFLLITSSLVAAGPAEGQFTTSLMLLLVWWTVFGPMAAGYIVASLAKRLPFRHGVVVAVLGFLPLALVGESAALWLWLVWFVSSLLSCLVGAWIWRYRVRGA